MPDYSGQQFGNYRLLRLIGEGGFAAVYLGEHVRLGMKAALKILHTHLSAPGDIELFQQEARTIADLRHPHIVRVLDFDVQQGQPFLVLDYAPSGSLSQRHPRGTRVPPELVASYVTQIAAALQYAHDHRLIHRDIKPANMLIGEQDTLLLSDFGIATVVHATSSMRTENSLGTLAYMAPEQLQGKPRPASDQYALAVTTYLWLTGNLPFQGSSTEIIGQHLSAAPPSMQAQMPALSAEIEQVVMAGLAKDPARRFGRVQDFAQALTQASQSLNRQLFAPTQIGPMHPPQPLAATLPAFPPAATPPASVSQSRLFLPGRSEQIGVGAIVDQQLAPPRAVSEPDSTGQPATSSVPVDPKRVKRFRIEFMLVLLVLYSCFFLLFSFGFFTSVPMSEALEYAFIFNSCYCFLMGLLVARLSARLSGALLFCLHAEAMLTIALLITYTSSALSAALPLLLLNSGCSLIGCLLGKWPGGRKTRVPQKKKGQ